MELVNSLEFTTLRQFISPVERFVALPGVIEGSGHLHVVCGDHGQRAGVIRTCIESLREANGQTVVVDLGLWSRHLESQLGGHFGTEITVRTDIESFTQLLRCLMDMLEYKLDRMDLPLKLLVLDDLSVFHWDLLVDGTLEEEYTALAKILQRLRHQFGTAIVTTSLGVEFESGMTLKHHRHHQNKPVYCQWSCIPPVFLQQTHDIMLATDAGHLLWSNASS